jgi:trans-aconitate methyltransferase
MSRHVQEAVTPGAFEARYQACVDPWNYRSSPYEREKYEITLRSLGRERYSRAFEPACSIGELTALLAARCDFLLASDVSETALKNARQRCSHFPHVQFERQDLRRQSWELTFDLVLLSEVGYYFDSRTLEQVAKTLAAKLPKGGELVAVHWRGHSADHVLHGDEVHRILRTALPLKPTRSDRYPGFHLDAWVKP